MSKLATLEREIETLKPFAKLVMEKGIDLDNPKNETERAIADRARRFADAVRLARDLEG